jgi:hypothetical protein
MLPQSVFLLRQLERNVNLGRYVHRTAIAGRRAEANLLCHAAGFFVEPVP